MTINEEIKELESVSPKTPYQRLKLHRLRQKLGDTVIDNSDDKSDDNSDDNGDHDNGMITVSEKQWALYDRLERTLRGKQKAQFADVLVAVRNHVSSSLG